MGEFYTLEIVFFANVDSMNIDIGVQIYNSSENSIIHITASDVSGFINLADSRQKSFRACFNFAKSQLVVDNYRVDIVITDNFGKILCVYNEAVVFEIINTGLLLQRNITSKIAAFVPEYKFVLDNY